MNIPSSTHKLDTQQRYLVYWSSRNKRYQLKETDIKAGNMFKLAIKGKLSHQVKYIGPGSYSDNQFSPKGDGIYQIVNDPGYSINKGDQFLYRNIKASTFQPGYTASVRYPVTEIHPFGEVVHYEMGPTQYNSKRHIKPIPVFRFNDPVPKQANRSNTQNRESPDSVSDRKFFKVVSA